MYPGFPESGLIGHLARGLRLTFFNSAPFVKLLNSIEMMQHFLHVENERGPVTKLLRGRPVPLGLSDWCFWLSQHLTFACHATPRLLFALLL